MNRLAATGDGIANVCVDLACQQSDECDVVGIATSRGGFTDLSRAHGVDLFEIDLQRRSVGGVMRAAAELRRVVKLFKPDILHAHTIAAVVLSRGAVLGTSTPVVATVHNEYQRGVILMGAAHTVVGVSEAVSTSMRRRKMPASVRTVLNGTVGSPRRRTSAVPPEGLQRPAVTLVGAVSHRKGADVAVEMACALATSHGAHTYFVGNVDWEEPRRTAAAQAPDNVHFLGFRSDPRAVLEQTDVFVLASRRDPAPLVLIEALEAGRPIVATRVDGVPEILGDETGLLVNAEDAGVMSRTVGRLLDDEALRHSHAASALKRSRHFSVERVVAEYRTIYDELIALRRPS